MNKENQAMELINMAHKHNGLFSDSIETEKGAVWLTFVFDDKVWQTKFNSKVHAGSMCKCMKLGPKGNFETSLMI